MVRSASRDIFDARALLRRVQRGQLDQEKLRVGFVVYGGISRKDWRTIAVNDITAEPLVVKRELVPMLRAEIAPASARRRRRRARQVATGGRCRGRRRAGP